MVLSPKKDPMKERKVKRKKKHEKNNDQVFITFTNRHLPTSATFP